MSEPLRWVVRDAMLNAEIEVDARTGARLTGLYPTRFKIVSNKHYTHKKGETMPALPAQTEKLENGIHKLTCISVRTIEGKYGPQEEATCMVGDTDKQTRVWISHSSFRQVKAAAEAGLVKIDEDTEEWNVAVGARFAAVVAGGKIIGLMPIDD